MVQFKGRKIIQLSKKKLVSVLTISIVFVAIGLLLIIGTLNLYNHPKGNIIYVLISGVSSLLFFGLCAINIGIKLLDKNPGLIIDNLGINDNSSGVSVGQIFWSDIESISVYQIFRAKFIILKVKNPQEYIHKQANLFKRKMMIMNYKMCGSPLSIGSNALEISFNELFVNINDSFIASRR